MEILARYAFKSIGKNKGRSIATAIGIMLSVVLITGIFTTASSGIYSMRAFVLDTSGSWHVSAQAIGDEALQELQNSPDISCVQEFKELGSAPVSEANREDFKSRVRRYTNFITVRTLPETVAGTTPTEANGLLAPVPNLKQGRLPESGSEIILPASFEGWSSASPGVSTQGKLELGSTLQLTLVARSNPETGDVLTSVTSEDERGEQEVQTPLATKTYTVVGFFDDTESFTNPLFEKAQGEEMPLIVLTKDDGSNPVALGALASLKNPRGFTTDVRNEFTKIFEKHDSKDYTKLATPRLVSADRHVENDLLIEVSGGGTRSVTQTIFTIALILTLVISLCSISLIYNSFAISITGRTRQFALLTSLGATRAQIRGLVFLEAALLGILSILIGLSLGIAATHLTLEFFNTQMPATLLREFGTRLQLHVDLETIALITTCASLVILISAWVPAWRASRLSPIAAIRQTQDIRLSKRYLKKLSRREKKGLAASSYDYPETKRPFGKLFGISWVLAHKNGKRKHSSRNNIAISIGISITLFALVGILEASFTPFLNSSALNLGNNGGIDAVITNFAAAPEKKDVIESKVRKELEGISDTEIAFTAYTVEGDISIPGTTFNSNYVKQIKKLHEHRGGSIEAEPAQGHHFGDDNSYTGKISLFTTDKSSWEDLCKTLKIQTNPSQPEAIVRNTFRLPKEQADKYSASEDIFTELPLMDVRQKDGSIVQIKTVGSFTGADNTWAQVMSITSDELCIILSPEASKNLDYNEGLSGMAIGLRSSNVEAVKSALDKLILTEGEGALSLTDIGETLKLVSFNATVIRTLLGLFAGIVTLVALVNLFNTLTTSVILRRRELAVLTSQGMSKVQLSNMLGFEAASYLVRGLLVGLIGTWAILYNMTNAIAISIEQANITPPWNYLGVAIGAVVLCEVLSVVYALYQTNKSSIVETLRNDVF